MSISQSETTELDKVHEVEGEIRKFVRRDINSMRRDRETDSQQVANNISSLLQRVAGTSVQEIDRLIAELQSLRETLSTEGDRVRREIARYATLSQSALQSTKIIGESIAYWRQDGVPDAPKISE
jgi:hypothetical protein